MKETGIFLVSACWFRYESDITWEACNCHVSRPEVFVVTKTMDDDKECMTDKGLFVLKPGDEALIEWL